MTAPRRPENEETRLAALRRLDVLGAETEPVFENIVRLAARLFCAPSAAISLIGDEREWFMSCVGTPDQGDDRDLSFCGYTILRQEPLVVEDALLDPRFADNPRVADGKVRFYAGAPLRASDGSLVGALCIRDPKPRSFSYDDTLTLRDLAETVSALLQYRAAARAIAA